MKLCIGTAQFGMDYGIQRAGQPCLADALEMLDIAVQNGVYMIDTAAAYGTAEEVVGAFIQKNKGVRNKIELTSKLPSRMLDIVPQEQQSETIRKYLLQSLSKLNTDYLDYYLLHNPAHINNDDIIQALRLLKSEGLVLNIGASVYTPEEAEQGIERGFDVLQIPYSVFDQRMEEKGIIDLAFNMKVKLHSRSAFTQGLMLINESEVPKQLEKAKPVVRKLAVFCEERSISRLQLAVAFVNTQTTITHLVFGVDKKEQLFEIIETHKKVVDPDILSEAACLFSNLEEDIIMPSKWDGV